MNKVTWLKRYELAKNYYEKYGNLEIKASFITLDGITHDEKGYKLGLWIIKQRQHYSNNKLSEEMIQKLENIGMIWNINDHIWFEYYNLAKKYYLEHGNLQISTDYVVDDKKLGKWIHGQRKAYKQIGTYSLTPKRIELLNEIEMVWSVHNKWYEYYCLAKKYYKTYGNLLIKKDDFRTKDGINYDEDGLNIGVWVSNQRRNKDTLTKDQIKKLEEIGMIWNADSYRYEVSNKEKWLEKYKLAKKYYEKYGHLRIPSNFITIDGVIPSKNGIKLGYWIVAQRRVYKGLRQGNLTKEQISLLDEIGMVWSVDQIDENTRRSTRIPDKTEENKEVVKEKWLKKYKLVKDYFIKNKVKFIPMDYVTSDGLKLGLWFYNQRQAYFGYTSYRLDMEEIKLLEELGIKWCIKTFDKRKQKEEITNNIKIRKEIEILNRCRSHILSYSGDTLPSKEKINNDFVKVLSK